MTSKSTTIGLPNAGWGAASSHAQRTTERSSWLATSPRPVP